MPSQLWHRGFFFRMGMQGDVLNYKRGNFSEREADFDISGANPMSLRLVMELLAFLAALLILLTTYNSSTTKLCETHIMCYSRDLTKSRNC